MKGDCRNCGRRMHLGARRLCMTCYRKSGYLHPRKAAGCKPRADETTEADLDALEAEQRLCLPVWWARHEKAQREAAGERLGRTAVPVKLMGGTR